MMGNELSVCFKESEEFGLWLQLAMALPLLPTNRIEEAWSQLKIYPVDVPHGYKGKFKVTKYFTQLNSLFTASCEPNFCIVEVQSLH